MTSQPSFDFIFQSLSVRGLNKSIKRRAIFRWLHNQKHHFTWFLILNLMIDESHLILVNIYAPNDANQHVSFFKDLENRLVEFAEENIIVAGDFNCALSDKDKKGGNPVSKKAIVIKEIHQLANLYNLTDIWRDQNPKNERFTWRNKSLKTQCRLDFFLISKELSNVAQSCNIINAPETDHSAITLHLKTEDLMQLRGAGFGNSTIRYLKMVTPANFDKTCHFSEKTDTPTK